MDDLRALLVQHGFDRIELFDAPRIQSRYVAGLVFPQFMQLVLARTGGAGRSPR